MQTGSKVRSLRSPLRGFLRRRNGPGNAYEPSAGQVKFDGTSVERWPQRWREGLPLGFEDHDGLAGDGGPGSGRILLTRPLLGDEICFLPARFCGWNDAGDLALDATHVGRLEKFELTLSRPAETVFKGVMGNDCWARIEKGSTSCHD